MKSNPWVGRHPLAPKILNTKYLIIDWSSKPRPDGRKFRLRRNRSVSNVYLQVSRLEIVVWYR